MCPYESQDNEKGLARGEVLSMRNEICECGYTKEGYRVRAITDESGSHVMVSNDKRPKDNHLLSKELEDREDAIELGYEVVESGIQVYPEWEEPVGELIEFARSVLEERNTVCKCGTTMVWSEEIRNQETCPDCGLTALHFGVGC